MLHCDTNVNNKIIPTLLIKMLQPQKNRTKTHLLFFQLTMTGNQQTSLKLGTASVFTFNVN